MKIVKGYVSTGFVGSTRKFEFEVDDDATDEDIEQMALDAMYSEIDWNYEVVEK